MQGLIEENMLAQDDSQERGVKEKDSGKANQSFIDSLKVNKVSNADGLELKVKKELEDQGFLDPDDENDDQEPEDDLILYEMVRQEIREKLAEADRDVRDAYTRILEVRSRKESPSADDRENAFRAIKVREAILKQLEAI